MDTFESLGRIQAIGKLYEGTPYKPFEASSFEASGSVSLVSKSFLEGVDFDLTYFPLKHLGYKSVVMTTGELYSQLCEASVLDVTISISSKLDFDKIKELFAGVVLAAKDFGYRSVNLDILPSVNGLCIALAAAGVKVLPVQQPKSMDVLCLTGNLGAAYLGLLCLEREKKNFDGRKQPDLEEYKGFVGAYLKPELKPFFPSLIKDSGFKIGVSTFVNRGLADAVLEISSKSGLGAKVYVDRIPFAGNTFEVSKKFGVDAISCAFNGGDDARLLFSLPISEAEKFRRDFQEFEIIGHLALPEVGSVVVMPDGVELPLNAQGWK